MIPYNYTIPQYRAISICARIAALKLQWEASDEASKIIDAKWTRLELNALKEQLEEIKLTLDFIEDKGLNYHRGNCIKYIARAGKKDPSKEIEDLEKGLWYLQREINRLKNDIK